MRRLAAILAALVATGCAGSNPAEEAVVETAINLEEIRSGTLSLRLVVDDQRTDDGAGVGFTLEGPFSLAEGEGLPVARLEYTRIAGADATSVTLISTGERAYVEIDGSAYELPEERAAALRGGDGLDLRRLRIPEWIRDPELERAGEQDRIRARLDLSAAAGDLLDLARDLGVEGAPELSAEDVAQLEAAVRSSRVELLSGHDDRLLRRLAIDVRLGTPDEALRELAGASIEFRLALDRLNEPVSVEEPADALPFDALAG